MDRLNEEQIAEFRAAFSVYDKNQTGFLPAKEIARCLRSLGLNPTEMELQNLVNEVDYDGNGKIDFQEFVDMMVLNVDQTDWSDKDLIEAFRTFDSDDKGYILAEELRYVLNRMDDGTASEDDIDGLVFESKLDMDRKITFSEFKFLVKRTHMMQRCRKRQFTVGFAAEV